MPLRARSGSLSGDPSGAPPANLSLAAAAASATAAAPAAARHAGVHYGVRREGHLYSTSRSTDLTSPVLYRPRRRDGSPASVGTVNVSHAKGPIILRGVKVPLSLPGVLRNSTMRGVKLPGQGSRCPPFRGNG